MLEHPKFPLCNPKHCSPNQPQAAWGPCPPSKQLFEELSQVSSS